MTATDPGPATLEELEGRLKRDFELLVIPPVKDWLEPRAHPEFGPALDVAVIGAGMSGLAASFALKCLAIRSVKVFDRSPAGFEGPWATFARMETLRSPPELSGPAFGFSNLTFRAWFEAQFGLAEWKKVNRIPRLQWMDYLRWYRKVDRGAGRKRHDAARHRWRRGVRHPDAAFAARHAQDRRASRRAGERP